MKTLRDDIVKAANRWASALEAIAECSSDRPDADDLEAITEAETDLLTAVLRWRRTASPGGFEDWPRGGGLRWSSSARMGKP